MALKDLAPWNWSRTCVPVDRLPDTDRTVSNLHSNINSLFDEFWNGGVGSMLGTNGANASGRGRFVPSVDISENEAAYVVRAELPGLKAEDVQLELHDQVLTIQGEKRFVDEGEKDGQHYRESRYGSFQRRIGLPEGIDPDQVSADVQDGVLTVTVPKAPTAKPRKIAIGVNGNGDS